MVRFHKDFHINITGDLCVDARDGIRFHREKNITAEDIQLYSKKIIAIQKGATINVSNLSMTSNGESIDSRVHIRNTSTVNAKSLNLYATKRATLGYDSNYNILESINVESRDEFSSIWRNTSVTSPQVIFKSENLVKFAKDVNIVSEDFQATAAECKVRHLQSDSTSSCFDN